jgi:hypothetical protein
LASDLTWRRKDDELVTQLKNERSTFDPHWRDLADYVLPRRIQLSLTDTNKGDKRNQKIIDNTATLAARTLMSGMTAGITSPARPWFRLTTPDPDLAEFGPVKVWLEVVRQRMTTVFLRSNLYNALPTLYRDQGVFGTAAMAVMEDMDDGIRCYPFTLGAYWLALNDRLVVNTAVREMRLTVRQVVQWWVRKPDGSFDWSSASDTLKNLWDTNKLMAPVDVLHVVTENDQRDPARLGPAHKAFRSCYYELAASQDKALSVSGFDAFPVLAPRWDVSGTDVYGTSCPGMDTLGDIKALQAMTRRKAESVEKMNRPPMVAPTSLKNATVGLLPGYVTFEDSREGQRGLRPAYEVKPDIQGLVLDIQEHQFRIKRGFFEDLFLMLATSPATKNMTAREVAERHEEKLLMIGPTLERENDELLDPLVDLVFGYMARRGEISPAPDEIQGLPLKVEYVSIMAQAQKLVGLSGLERFSGYAGQLIAVKPDVQDKIDFDQAIDEYAEMTGVPPQIVRADDAVAAIRDERTRQQAEAAQLAKMQAMAEGARTLSETTMDAPNALTALTGAVP